MNITANCDRTTHRLHIALLGKDLASLSIISQNELTYLVAQSFDFVLWNGLVIKELLNLAVEHGDFLGGKGAGGHVFLRNSQL